MLQQSSARITKVGQPFRAETVRNLWSHLHRFIRITRLLTFKITLDFTHIREHQSRFVPSQGPPQRCLIFPRCFHHCQTNTNPYLLEECTQQIQPLLITGNRRQFYFGWKAADRVGFVKTSATLPLLSLIAADNSRNPSFRYCPSAYMEQNLTERKLLQGYRKLGNQRETKHWLKLSLMYTNTQTVFSCQHIAGPTSLQLRASRQMPRVPASQLAMGLIDVP